MVGPLQRVTVCLPRAAGWDDPARVGRWRELGFHHSQEYAQAQEKHEALCSELASSGADLLEMPGAAELSLDAVYAHDASFATDYGLILMRPGKPNRVAEAAHHRSACEGFGIPTL